MLRYLLLICLSGMVAAYCGCVDEFFGGVEATFLKPCTPNLYFVAKGPPNPTTSNDLPFGDLLALQPEYGTGFRAWVGAAFCDSKYDARFGWDYLHTSDRRRVVAQGPSENLLFPLAHADFNPNLGPFQDALATYQVRLDYDAADFELGYRKGTLCDSTVRLVGALRYAMIGYRGRILMQGHQTDQNLMFRQFLVREQSWAWGVGPRVAVEGHYWVCNGFGLRGAIGASLLAGELSGDYNVQELTGAGRQAILDAEDVCTLIPNIDIEVGIDYTYCSECFFVTVGAGYRASRFWSSVQRLTWVDNSNESTYSLDDNPMDFYGFYVGAEIGF